MRYTLLVLLALLAIPLTVQAEHRHFKPLFIYPPNVSLYIGPNGYYYVQPAPVYQPPQPVYVAPPPVIVQPAPAPTTVPNCPPSK